MEKAVGSETEDKERDASVVQQCLASLLVNFKLSIAFLFFHAPVADKLN